MRVLPFAPFCLATLVCCLALLSGPAAAAPIWAKRCVNHRTVTVTATATSASATPSGAAVLDNSGAGAAPFSVSVALPTVSAAPPASASASVAHSHSHSHSSSVTASASASTPSSTPPASPPSSGSGPRFVVYTDDYIPGGNGLPSANDLTGFNVLALSFLLTSGAVDQAAQFASLSAADRASTLQAYHDAGISVIVSAFGSTDAPTTAGADPVQTANTMAAWVKKYGLDGIDVDYEDFTALNGGHGAVQWLNTFTKTLRAQLPAGQYTLSHAPVAPWFQENAWPDNGYLGVHQAVGDLIDWYNVQFYNQGADMYTTCTGLVSSSGGAFPGTSVLEIGKAGVPLDKIVIGKPGIASDAANGFISQAELASCVATAQAAGWNAGVMSWEFPHAETTWITTVRAAAFPL